jgi:asparagine synthase (glutamine-hydrolysing)
VEGILLFGSELRALMQHPAFKRDIDHDAVAALAAYSYIPAPATIFKNVFKLRPGEIMTVSSTGGVHATRYWRIEAVVRGRGQSAYDLADSRDALDALLRDSVRRRIVADVPVGAFLSGGIDSSIVVALMQAQPTSRVRSFTIGFENSAYDELSIGAQLWVSLTSDEFC